MANQISRIRNRMTLLFGTFVVIATILLIVAIPMLSSLPSLTARRARIDTAIFGAAVLVAGIVLLRLYLRPISDLSYALEIGSAPAPEIARDARRIAYNAPVYVFALSTGGVLVVSSLYNLAITILLVDHVFSAHVVSVLLSTAVAACGSLIVALGSRQLMQPVLRYTSARAQAAGIRVSIRIRALAAFLSVVLLAVVWFSANYTNLPGSRQAGATVTAVGLPALLSIGLAFTLGHLFAQDLVSEIDDVSDRLDQAAREERLSLSSALPVLACDEVGDLVVAQNALQRQVRLQQEQAEHRQRQLVALQSLTYKIGTLRDIDHLLQQVIRDVERAFGYHNVSILLTGEEGEELYFAATELLDASLRERRFRVGMDGVVGHAAATGKPLLVNDVSACDFYIPDGTNTRSELAVPLTLNNKVFGVLNVSSERTGAFEESDLQIVVALANQVAIVIENARLLSQNEASAAELERRKQSLNRLHDLSLSISAALRQQDLLNTVTQQLVSLLKVEHGAVLWIDQDENRVWVAAEHPPQNILNQQLSLQQVPAVQRILAAPQARQFVDVQHSESWGALRELLGNVEAGSMLLVPVTAKGRVEGGIVLSTLDANRAFTEDELSMCEMVAAQTGVAMQNVRLMEATRLQGPRSKDTRLENARSENARSENAKPRQARPQRTRPPRAHD